MSATPLLKRADRALEIARRLRRLKEEFPAPSSDVHDLIGRLENELKRTVSRSSSHD